MLLDWPTWVIVTALSGLMFAANESGFRLGQRNHQTESEHSRSVSNVLKGSVFGLVALLLGFSFSATTSRYDVRQRVVLDQANAVGTCRQRAGLFDDASRERIRSALRRYVRGRLEHDRPERDEADRARTVADTDRTLDELWAAVEDANRREPEKVRNSLVVPAANEVCDLDATRAWANRNHLPNPVRVLLLASVVISCALLGHSSGLGGTRHVALWLATNALFALVLFVVLDFDRPRRGLIGVDQTPLVELDATLERRPAP